MQPLLASSEYTVPFWLPTNTRPPATVGCDQAEVASGNPNAHFSESRGTCSAVSPAFGPDWNRVLAPDGDHPFHSGEDAGSDSGGARPPPPPPPPPMPPPPPPPPPP